MERVGLEDALGTYPHELSGGTCQRGAIARALAIGTPILLIDEPFGALDPVNRTHLQDLLLKIRGSTQPARTVLFVTHDVDEAIVLVDRVIVFGANPGRVIADIAVDMLRLVFRKATFARPEFQKSRHAAWQLFARLVPTQQRFRFSSPYATFHALWISLPELSRLKRRALFWQK